MNIHETFNISIVTWGAHFETRWTVWGRWPAVSCTRHKDRLGRIAGPVSSLMPYTIDDQSPPRILKQLPKFPRRNSVCKACLGRYHYSNCIYRQAALLYSDLMGKGSPCNHRSMRFNDDSRIATHRLLLWCWNRPWATNHLPSSASSARYPPIYQTIIIKPYYCIMNNILCCYVYV